MKLDFNLKKLENKVQIDVDKWISTSPIELRKMNGGTCITCVSTAEEIGKNVNNIKKGDKLFLSKMSCYIATAPTSPYIVEGKRYYNIPSSQIIGIFDKDVDFNSLNMQENKVLFKKIYTNDSILYLEDNYTMLGEVLKVGANSMVQQGQIILLKDNISTPIKLGSTEYYAADGKDIIGVFPNKGDVSTESLTIINGNILMKPYVSKKVLNSTLLETPEINYEDLDYSDVYNRDLFKVYYIDKEIRDIHRGSVLLVNRDYTSYVYFNNEKYFVIDGKRWVSGKIIERTK